jgi:hypothetical protein
MEFLSEDPTYVLGVLGILTVGFLIALKVTQQGKYLLYATGVFALAALLVVVERLWVTDAERIEQEVYALGKAVASSDAQGVLDRLTPDVQYVIEGRNRTGEDLKERIMYAVSNAKFDVLRISKLHARAGEQSRRGTAEFKVFSSGEFQPAYSHPLHFAATNSSWSLGFREISPGVWKVYRISPAHLPGLSLAMSADSVLKEPLAQPEVPVLYPRRRYRE